MVSFFDGSQPTSCTSVLQQFELSSFKNVGFFFFLKMETACVTGVTVCGVWQVDFLRGSEI